MSANEPASDVAALLDRSRRFGRYQLGACLAKGGMASVYLARVEAPGGFAKHFALKMIHPHLAGDPRMAAMFLHEARLAARISHPNVCSVVDFGEAHGDYYLVMEFLHGETLLAVVRAREAEGGLPFDVAMRVVADAARGLHAAHELRDPDGRSAAVVHRDVSPTNIFVLHDGVTKVTDFGVARSTDALREQTATGELRGKLAYMAPEQVMRGDVDRRTDVFALGVVLWEATLGRRLFRRESEGATILAVLQDAIPPPGSLRADYPPALERVVMRALSRDPDGRFRTAGAMADALEEALAHAGQLATATRVAGFMHELFADAPDPRSSTDDADATGRSDPRDEPSSSDSVAAPTEVTTEPTATQVALPRHSARRGLVAGAALAALATLVVLDIRPRHHAAPPPPVTASPRAQPAPSPVAPPSPVAIPAARVQEGHRVLGATPLIHAALPPGRHTLRLLPLRAGGHAHTMAVTIRAGERTAASWRSP